MYRIFPLLIIIIIGSSIGIFPYQISPTLDNFLYNAGIEAPMTPYTSSMLKFSPSTIRLSANLKNDNTTKKLTLDNVDLYEVKLPLLYLIDTYHLKLNSMGAEKALCKGISKHFKYENIRNLILVYNQNNFENDQAVQKNIEIECSNL